MHTYSTYSDEQLVALLKESDDQLIFQEIYNRYWKPLFTISVIRLKDFQLAEEVVQDVFFNFWKKRYQLQITGQLSHYLSAATKYEIINARIKQEKNKSRELQFLEIDENLLSTLPTTEHELKDLFAKVVNNLSDKSQLVFQLSRGQGYSNKEIANHLNISEKAVEYHITKTIKFLRATLSSLFSVLLHYLG